MNMTTRRWLALSTMMLLLAAPAALAQDADGGGEGGFQPAGEPAGDAPGGDAPAGDGEPVDAEEAPADGQQPPGQPGGGLFSGPFFWILIGAFVLMMVFSSRSRKKQQKKRQEMIEQLKKGDKVVTIGGIVGTVVETREGEVVVKVDDNARMKFARWAIRTVGEEARDDAKQNQQEQK
jgi:preprotein translocase subunit YajC